MENIERLGHFFFFFAQARRSGPRAAAAAEADLFVTFTSLCGRYESSAWFDIKKTFLLM